jgi:pre-mRNA 3'-end-processing factor FIP1
LRFTHHRTAFDVDIETLESHPWRKKNANLSDYFNFGFDEDSWKVYCEKQLRIRAGKGLGPFNPAAISGANRPATLPNATASRPNQPVPSKPDNNRAYDPPFPPSNRIPAPPMPPSSFAQPFPPGSPFPPVMPGMYPPMPTPGLQNFLPNTTADPSMMSRPGNNARVEKREDSRDRDRLARDRREEIDRDFGRDRDLGKSKREEEKERDQREKDRERDKDRDRTRGRSRDTGRDRDRRERSRSRDRRRR